jgi:hypothetical protein
MPTRTTVEIKWGDVGNGLDYFFIFPFRMTFRSRAKMMGMGKPAMS